jgi:hypothetical protein
MACDRYNIEMVEARDLRVKAERWRCMAILAETVQKTFCRKFPRDDTPAPRILWVYPVNE